MRRQIIVRRFRPVNFALIGLATLAGIGWVLSSSATQALDSKSASGGRCSLTSHWVLDATQNNGKIEVEFEVIQKLPVSQPWSVIMRDNSTVIFKQILIISNEGSFSAIKLTNNLSGVDMISAKAVNQRTHEICQGSVRF